MSMSHVFLRVFWQLSPWQEMGLEMEGLWPEPGVSCVFSSAGWPASPYWWWGQVSSRWSRSTEGQVQVGFIPSKCVLSCILALAPSPQREALMEQEESQWVLDMGVGAGSGSPSTNKSSGLLPILCLCKHQQWPSSPCSDAVPGLSWFLLSQMGTPLSCSRPCLSVELQHRARGDWNG